MDAGTTHGEENLQVEALEARRQEVEAALAQRRESVPPPVPHLGEGPKSLREAGRQVEALLEAYSRGLRSGESAERLGRPGGARSSRGK